MTEMAARRQEDQYLRDLETVLARNKRSETPRPLPATKDKKPPNARPLPLAEFGRGGADAAAERMELRESGHSAESARIDEAKALPKRMVREVDVDSPYGKATNKTDRVEKVIDTIEHMLRSRQIDRGQEAAARMVQDSWATAHGSMRCVLAPSAGGGGGGSGTLTDAQIRAGEILNDVRKKLGELDAPIVIRICAIGMSIEETARMVFGVSKATMRQHHHVGMRLRLALQHLARHWRIEVRRGKVVQARGAIAGHENGANFGALNEAERERLMPLRHAAERRERKLRGKRRAKPSAKKSDGRTR